MTVEKRLGFFEGILDDYVDGIVQDVYYVSRKAEEFIELCQDGTGDEDMSKQIDSARCVIKLWIDSI